MPQRHRAYISLVTTFYPIEIKIEGRRHQGQWSLRQGGRLCVGGFYGSRTIEIDTSCEPVNAAAQVLAELVREWQARELGPPVEAKRRARPERPFQLTVLVEGRPYSGTWRLLGGIVFVYSAYGGRDAAVKRSTPERTAERLLKELVAEWLKAPET